MTRVRGKIPKLLPPIRGTIEDDVWRLGILTAPTARPIGLLREA